MRLIFLLGVFLSSCTVPSEGIEVPQLGDDFYRKALNQVAKSYEKSPTRELLAQKLYYQERLGWPEESIRDLKEAERRLGLTKQIVHYFCDYYYSNGRYYELLEAVNVSKSLEQPDEQIYQYEILARAKLSEPIVTSQYLRRYLATFKSASSLEFGVEQYLSIGDTLMGVYYLNKLQKQRPGHEKVPKLLVPSLIRFGYREQALQALNDFAVAKPQASMEVVSLFLELGEKQRALQLLRGLNTDEAQLQLVSLFRSERVFDSAIFYTDRLLMRDSTRDYLLLKGEIMEDRGWLTSAYFIFQSLYEQSPEDSLVGSRAQIVARKIAYLRRVREAETLAPISKIEPTKLTE